MRDERVSLSKIKEERELKEKWVTQPFIVGSTGRVTKTDPVPTPEPTQPVP